MASHLFAILCGLLATRLIVGIYPMAGRFAEPGLTHTLVLTLIRDPWSCSRMCLLVASSSCFLSLSLSGGTEFSEEQALYRAPEVDAEIKTPKAEFR